MGCMDPRARLHFPQSAVFLHTPTPADLCYHKIEQHQTKKSMHHIHLNFTTTSSHIQLLISVDIMRACL